MASSIVIPTPPGSGPVTLAVGKYGREWSTPAEAVAWAEDFLGGGDNARDLLMALSIVLAARRPASRGRTLTINLAAAANLLTLGA